MSNRSAVSAASPAPGPGPLLTPHDVARAVRARLGIAATKAPDQPMNPLDTEAALQLAAASRPPMLAPVLPAGSLMLLHGPRGVGCSHVLLGCAAALVTAGSFLGWWAPRALPVLFISGTASSASLGSRLRAALPAACGRKPAGNRFTLLAPERQASPMPALDTRQGLIRLAPFLAPADIVLIDDAAALVPGMIGTAARSQSQLAEFLRLMRHAGKAVIVSQHSGEAVRGRADRCVLACLETHADVVVGLRRPRDYDVADGARFELHIERARHLPGKARHGREVALEVLDSGALQWSTASAADSVKARFLALLADGMPGHEAGRELGLPRTTAWRWARGAAAACVSAPAADAGGATTQAVDTITEIAA